MKMIPGTGTISNYGQFINNCQRNQLPYKIPVNSLSDVQLYINIGAVKPDAVQYELIHTCGGGTIESITPGSYVVAQDSNSNWYGVFKNFSGASPVCFVISITLTFGAEDQIYFSEEYCIETNCKPLTLLKGCYGNLDNKLSYDCEGVYFGTHAGEETPLGDPLTVYKHELLIRGAEVYLSAIKNSFKQGRTRNFRTEKEKLFQFNAELVPEWYLSEVDAVFYRGEVYVGTTRYLVNETAYELIEECKKQWVPRATFKESCLKSFSCESDPCSPPITECCDPAVISTVVTEVPFESGFPEESGSGGGGFFGDVVVVQAVVDQTPNVTGTFDAVTGIVNGSFVVTCAAFAGVRVYVERGGIMNPGIDPLDGSQYHTKNPADNFITFSAPLSAGEFVYIETIP